MEVPKPKRIVDKDILEKIRKRPCDACGRLSTKDIPNHAAHIKSRGAHGNDTWDNLLSLCLFCHGEQHQSGFWKLCQKHPFLGQKLAQMGFEFDSMKRLRRSEHYAPTGQKFFGKL